MSANQPSTRGECEPALSPATTFQHTGLVHLNHATFDNSQESEPLCVAQELLRYRLVLDHPSAPKTRSCREKSGPSFCCRTTKKLMTSRNTKKTRLVRRHQNKTSRVFAWMYQDLPAWGNTGDKNIRQREIEKRRKHTHTHTRTQKATPPLERPAAQNSSTLELTLS